MSFFDSIFGSSKPQEEDFWRLISQPEEVDEIFMVSAESTQIILKHSRSCGISFFAKKNMESITEEELGGVQLHLIDVIRNRPASNYLADKAGVRHESPQVFVIKNGEVTWHASHGMVTAQNILQALG